MTVSHNVSCGQMLYNLHNGVMSILQENGYSVFTPIDYGACLEYPLCNVVLWIGQW